MPAQTSWPQTADLHDEEQLRTVRATVRAAMATTGVAPEAARTTLALGSRKGGRPSTRTT